MAGTGSLEEFYSNVVGRLLGQVFPVTGDLHEAEEVVQEALTRAAVRGTRLRDYDVPAAWVPRVATNLAADRARSLGRQASAIVRLSPPPEVPAVSVQAFSPPGEVRAGMVRDVASELSRAGAATPMGRRSLVAWARPTGRPG